MVDTSLDFWKRKHKGEHHFQESCNPRSSESLDIILPPPKKITQKLAWWTTPFADMIFQYF